MKIERRFNRVLFAGALLLFALLWILVPTAGNSETITLTENIKKWTDGNTYTVNGDVTISSRVEVTGTVTLILNEGSRLTTKKGITVNEGNTLIIGGTGALSADASGNNIRAGIGAHSSSKSCGTIIINGGTITATGGKYAAGIGGTDRSAGTIIINGGTVNATGGMNAAGIGTGKISDSKSYIGTGGGTITINGGSVTATGDNYGAGIGCGKNGGGGTVTIHGGQVRAIGGTMTYVGIGTHMYNYPVGIELGWTDREDFIESTGYIGDISIAAGQYFVREGTSVYTTLDNLGYGRIVPAPAPVFFTIAVNAAENGSMEADKAYTMVGSTVTLTARSVYPYVLDSVTVSGAAGDVDVNKLRYDTFRFDMPDSNVTVTPVFHRLNPVILETPEGSRECIPIMYTGKELNGSQHAWYAVTENVSKTERIVVTGDVKLFLPAGKTMTCWSGIQVTEGNSLTILGEGTLIANGILGAAGIGGNKYQSNGNILIKGGTIRATGSANAAGIGGGIGAPGGKITITGGKVEATGGDEPPSEGNYREKGGAGIGGGYMGAGGNILITGGSVKATGGGGSAGIGGGEKGAGGNITISGGEITACGACYGAGIGGGNRGSGGNISISGGTVTASTEEGTGAEIGGGLCGDGGIITITGGRVVAYSHGSSDRGIGAGDSSENGTIILGWTNETDYIEARGYHGSVSFMEGKVFQRADTLEPVTANNIPGTRIIPRTDGLQTYSITVNTMGDGTVTTDFRQAMKGQQITITWETEDRYIIPHDLSVQDSSGQYYAVTQTNHNEARFVMPANDVTVYGRIQQAERVQKNTSEGKKDCYQIKRGLDFSDYTTGWYAVTEDTTISQRVTITGDVKLYLCAGSTLTCAQGITVNEGNSLTIEGEGTLIANAGNVDNAAGIGGYQGKSGTVTIRGGTVQATGGQNGAGIGSASRVSEYHPGGTVIIEGGNVTAQGGKYAAGIGSGPKGDGGTIRITGGVVSATGSNSGAGIGGGFDAPCGSVTISGGDIRAYGSGAGIGGENAANQAITISGGKVSAVGGIHSAGIGKTDGRGKNADTTITITGGQIYAEGGESAAGIGGDLYGSGGTIMIAGGQVNATGAVGIGHGEKGSGASITLDWTHTDDSIYATSYGGDVFFAKDKYFQRRDSGEIATRHNIGGTTIEPYASNLYTITVQAGANNPISRIYLEGLEPDAHLQQALEGSKVYVYCSRIHPYEPVGLKATTAGGAQVATAKEDDNIFSFVMPAANVTLESQVVETVPLIRQTSQGQKGCYRLDANMTTWDGAFYEGWYTLNRDVSMEDVIVKNGDVHLYLQEGTTLRCKGIFVLKGSNLTIEGNGTLISDASSLPVNCPTPGIGGHGSVVIKGGHITAKGNQPNPGIGYVANADGSQTSISIYGGDITAYGGTGGSGIGSGYGVNYTRVNIYGGTIRAYGGLLGAGIGGGVKSLNTSIRISGGTITAAGGRRGAGIGGGAEGGVDDITITGGVITASGGGAPYTADHDEYGAGIGTGAYTNQPFNSIRITGGQIRAKGGTYYISSSRGIGRGAVNNCEAGEIILGWTGSEDFIEADLYDTNVSFAAGQTFLLNGTETVATAENMNGVRIVPNTQPGTVTVAEGITHGTVTYSPAEVRQGDTVTLTVLPEYGYELETLTVTQGENPVEVMENQFLMPAGNVTVSATFRRLPDQVISFAPGDHGSGEMDAVTVAYGTVYSLPDCAYQAASGWSFAGWQAGEEAGKLAPAGGQITVEAAVTLTAVWQENYAVCFLNPDGSMLQWVDTAPGAIPVYPGEEPPQQAETEQFSYTFSHWDPELAPAGGENRTISYTAVYTAEPRSYPIHFVDWDGTELQDEEFAYGTMPEYQADNPGSDQEESGTTFAGWTPALATVTGEATYTAVYQINYSLREGDNQVFLSENQGVNYSFTATNDNIYQFWSPENDVFCWICVYDGNEIIAYAAHQSDTDGLELHVEMEKGKTYRVEFWCYGPDTQLFLTVTQMQAYQIHTVEVPHGHVDVSLPTAYEGKEVMLLTFVDDGYTCVNVNVTDANGQPVEVEYGDRFTMPAGDVWVTPVIAQMLPVTIHTDEQILLRNIRVQTEHHVWSADNVEAIAGEVVDMFLYLEEGMEIGSVTVTGEDCGAVRCGAYADEAGQGIHYWFVMPEEPVTVQFSTEKTYPAFGQANFILPTAMLTIEESAFEGDESITVVAIPSGCGSIGKRAFLNCMNLSKIRIPAGCTIGESALDGCVQVYVYGVKGSPAESYCREHANCEFVPENRN